MQNPSPEPKASSSAVTFKGSRYLETSVENSGSQTPVLGLCREQKLLAVDPSLKVIRREATCFTIQNESMVAISTLSNKQIHLVVCLNHIASSSTRVALSLRRTRWGHRNPPES